MPRVDQLSPALLEEDRDELLSPIVPRMETPLDEEGEILCIKLEPLGSPFGRQGQPVREKVGKTLVETVFVRNLFPSVRGILVTLFQVVQDGEKAVLSRKIGLPKTDLDLFLESFVGGPDCTWQARPIFNLDVLAFPLIEEPQS